MPDSKRASLIPQDVSLKKAEELRRTDEPYAFGQALLSEREFMGIQLPEREWVLRGLVLEESITIIYGFRGQGKSWLVGMIANAVSWGDRVGPWVCERARNVMVVDGEMPMGLLQERQRLLNTELDVGKKEGGLFIYPEAYAYRLGLRRASILDARWRDVLGQMVVDYGIEVLILDNLASLAPGIDENDKMGFDPVNRWLLEMRFGGVAIVMAHHTGKDGKQRGTSAHDDHVDTALVIKRPKDYGEDMGCLFEVWAEKDRAHLTNGMKWEMKLVPNVKGRLVFDWKVRGVKAEAVRRLIEDGGGLEDAEKMGISRRTFFRVKGEIEEKVKGEGKKRRKK